MDVALFTGLPPDAMPEPQAPIAHETHTVDLGPQPVAVPTPEPATPQPQHAVDLHQGVRSNPVTPEQLEQELAATWMRHVGLG